MITGSYSILLDAKPGQRRPDAYLARSNVRADAPPRRSRRLARIAMA